MSTVLSIVVDYVAHANPEYNVHLGAFYTRMRRLRVDPACTTDPLAPVDDPELRLPNRGSLAIMIATNALLQFVFFVTVSSAALYAVYLGGSALFSGLTIGIPIVFSGLALIPLTRYDGGRYSLPLKVAHLSVFLGSILHAGAYRAHFLYLILMGRIVSGLGFIGFVYTKCYCSDPRIIGIWRRTTFASWIVLGQAFGFSVGPFVGGLLYKTSAPPAPTEVSVEQYGIWQLNRQQWGVVISMFWSSVSCFILSGWESNIPTFMAAALSYTPFGAGKFIALGGIATLPFCSRVCATPRVSRTAPPSLRPGSSGSRDSCCWRRIALFSARSTSAGYSSRSGSTSRALARSYSNYFGRVTGAILGGAEVQMGMKNYVAVQIVAWV
ncbi:hypothetical protein MVEN_00943600 [Mycena venus]|uniref:MFS general substrate transporter n=1 Tax=Mycena venus TaxID=2733690 RepID=A0A8H6Y885_9AGAR|nr:hypothetical protein MVEN_00943600 [Mycena venus]